MSLIVHKYGGTSMGSIERIQNVARRVAKWHAAGHQVVVVPSAMSGETNRLLGLAKELSIQPDPRELDMLAATGEQASSALLAMALAAFFEPETCRGQPGQARTLRAGKAEVQAIGNAFFKYIQMLGQSQHGLHHVQVMNLRWVDSYQCIGQKVGLLLVIAFQTYSISYL